MASLASKNLYELLGNDPELDPERATPKPPTVVKDNPVSRIGKRDGPAEQPAAAAGGAPATRGGRRGGRDNTTGNERAYRDRDAGASENRRRAPDDGLREDRHPDRIRADRGEYRGRGRGRGASGGRGLARGAGRPDDRHSKTGVSDHDKQVAHGWGGNSGNDEWNDEKAGEAIAKDEEKQGFDTEVAAPVDADGNTIDADKPEEPEEPQTKGLADYLAEQTEKKLALNEGIAIRKPNEGASKKFPEGKALSRDQEEEDFIAGSGAKKTRERAKKEKNVLELDGNAMRPEQREERSSRGGRGGRGRGGDRPERPDRSDRPERSGDRPERAERGEYRGRGGRGRGEGARGRGDGARGRGSDFRGGRGGARGQSGPNVDDQSAFPSLGA